MQQTPSERDMRVATVESECYRVPVKVPLRDEPVTQTVVIARVETYGGLVGYGLAGAPGMPIATREFINKQLAPFLKDRDASSYERLWSAMLEAFNRRSLGGVWSMGVSAVDIAIWEILGKAWGTSVSSLLGGSFDEIPVYVTFGLAIYSRDELVEVAKSLVSDGHRALKLTVGTPPKVNVGIHRAIGHRSWEQVLEDAARVQCVREAVGPDIALLLDGNCLLSLAEAKRLARLVEPLDIAWFEEPIRRNDAGLLSELRRQTSIPIAVGQNLGSVWSHHHLIASRAVDIPQPNVCHVGGYTAARKVASVAEAHNLDIGHGGRWPYYNVHLHGGVPNGGLVELHLASWGAMDLLFSDVPLIRDGYVAVPRSEGLGFSPVEAALREFRMVS